MLHHAPWTGQPVMKIH